MIVVKDQVQGKIVSIDIRYETSKLPVHNIQCNSSGTGLKMRSCEQLEIFATRTKEIIMMSAIIYANYQQKRSPSYFNMPSSCLVLESGFPVTFSNDKFAHDFSFLQSNAKPENRYCCLQSPSNKVLWLTLLYETESEILPSLGQFGNFRVHEFYHYFDQHLVQCSSKVV